MKERVNGVYAKFQFCHKKGQFWRRDELINMGVDIEIVRAIHRHQMREIRSNKRYRELKQVLFDTYERERARYGY